MQPPADFPQMWQKPSFDEMLSCLNSLRLDPPIWNLKVSRKDIVKEQEASARFRRDVAAYLVTVIKSSLSWIQDDDQKEALWQEASRRLSERSGRAGMGEITRRWPFESEGSTPSFELIIREPPLTGDSLGLKTWGSSYVMAQQLHSLALTSLAHLFVDKPPPEALELGSGTGLLGLAAAAVWKTRVILSDLPEIMSNLRFNVEANRAAIESLGGSVDSGALTWGGSGEDGDPNLFSSKNKFKLIIVADPLYDDDHPQLLTSAIDAQLSQEAGARVVAMVPQRDLTTKKLLSSLKIELMACRSPLTCIEEGLVLGQDDWDEDDEASVVQCWWGVFSRDLGMLKT